MRYSVFLTFLLLGIGQNLPYGIYWYGLGIGDVCFVGTLILLSFHPRMRAEFGREVRRLSIPIALVVALAVFALCSLLYNAIIYGFAIRDIFELGRIGYLLVLMVFTAATTLRYGASPLVGFSFGIVVAGLVAYANPHRADLLGTVVVWNPNVTGNMMAVGIVFASMIALFSQRFIIALAIGVLCLVVAAFTFSKGTWLMCLFASLAFGAAILGARRKEAVRYGKAILLLLVVGVSWVANRNADQICKILEFKLATTQIDDSAVDGGTLAQRWGFVLSSKMMLMSNPVFGVGMSNYEQVNEALKSDLDGYYWESDNPHSAWLYLLACMGIPAFLLYFAFFVLVFQALRRAVKLTGVFRQIYLFSVITMFVLSGAVMLQLVAGYFFWVFAGVVFAHSRVVAVARSTPARALLVPSTLEPMRMNL